MRRPRDEGYRSYPGRSAGYAPDKRVQKIPTGVTHIERWWLNPQKSVLPIVPMKWLITRKGRGRRLAKADERS